MMRKFIARLRLPAAMTFVAFLGLQGCSTRSVNLIHPGSGATARCEETGSGIMAATTGPLVEECVKGYEGKGYVTMDKLSPEQRSDLERRGLLPKPAAPMGY